MVSALASNAENLPEFEISERDLGLPKYGEPAYNKSNNCITYMRYIADRWRPSEAELAEKHGMTKHHKHRVIEFMTARIVGCSYYEENFVASVCNHNDSAIRKGFYRAYPFKDQAIDLCGRYLERDGYAFCGSALENWSFYNYRDNKKLYEWLYETIDGRINDSHKRGEHDGEFRLTPRYEYYCDRLHRESSLEMYPGFEAFLRLSSLA